MPIIPEDLTKIGTIEVPTPEENGGSALVDNDVTNDALSDSDTETISQPPYSNSSIMLNGVVTISDKEAPLVILYGPTSCGKTMTLIRLTRFLRDKGGYTVTPDRSFRPSYDEAYVNDCNKFNQTVNDPIAQPGTSGYMLVDIINKEGRVLCKLLEAPGEYYFDPSRPNEKYPHYLNKIISAPNRKVWCAFLEPNWGDASDRAKYSDRIRELKPNMKLTDKMVFILNKIDLLPHLILAQGKVNVKMAQKYVSDHYNNIFAHFSNTIPIVNFFKPYNCFFVPFQTGDFTANHQRDDLGRDIILFSPGVDDYPANLWKIIRKSI